MGINTMSSHQETIHPTKADFAALILANILLATGPMFVRMTDVGPVAAGFWRMALALPVLALLASRGGPIKISRGLVFALMAAGLFFAADLASWHLGIVRTKLANATLFGNSASLIFPLYGFLIARAWPTRRQGGALGLAAIGAILLMGRSYELSPQNLVGDLLCLLAGLFYTFYFVMIARARTALAPLPLLAISTLASTLPLLLLALALGERIVPTNWTPLILLALCSQLAGQGLMTHVLGRLSPIVIGLGLLAQPVAAAVIGMLVFGEHLGLPDLAGAILVGLALVLVRQPARNAA
ncbi:MAG: family transporter [Sphingomonadales bacterium]|nr:family transporter [Sphingomonadales bacterium]